MPISIEPIEMNKTFLFTWQTKFRMWMFSHLTFFLSKLEAEYLLRLLIFPHTKNIVQQKSYKVVNYNYNELD